MACKLFVIVRADLPVPDQTVQSIHGVSAWILEHRNDYALKWNNHTLVCLQVKDEQWLSLWCEKLKARHLTFTRFEEPDFNMSLTAIACYTDGGGIFDGLKLLGT